MKENLEELNARSLTRFPVILGGAALTRGYVEKDLRAIYRGEVFYAGDAFDGLRLMAEIAAREPEEVRPVAPVPRRVAPHREPAAAGRPAGEAVRMRSDIRRDVPIPSAPFLGSRVVTDISLDDVFAHCERGGPVQNPMAVSSREGRPGALRRADRIARPANL